MSLRRRLSQALLFVVEVFEHFSGNSCPQLAAGLAYYAVFSVPPLLVLLGIGLGFFVDADQVHTTILETARSLASPELGDQLVDFIREANSFAATGPWWGIILSLLGVAFGATRGFAQLQTALNRTWGISPHPERRAVRQYVARRLVSFAMLAALFPLVLLSNVLFALELRFARELSRLLQPEVFDALDLALGIVVSVPLVTAILAVMYRFVPDARIGWKQALPGAAFAAFCFEGLKSLMASYLNHVEFSEAYGQASSLAIVLLWLYLSANLVFLGAEFAQVWSHYVDQPVEAEEGYVLDENAVVLTLTPKLRRWLSQRESDL